MGAWQDAPTEACPLAPRQWPPQERGPGVIVIGVDPHKQTHTAAAVEQGTGELRGERTGKARRQGHEQLLAWARSLAAERLWALEDCRHVSSAPERLLLASGERVVRVPPKLMAGARRGARQRGKSDAIDALAVARAALREPELPIALLEGSSREIRLLLDHREDLVGERKPGPPVECPGRQLQLRLELVQVPAEPILRACRADRVAPGRARADGAGAELPRARAPDRRADPARARARPARRG
jgi:Transposase